MKLAVRPLTQVKNGSGFSGGAPGRHNSDLRDTLSLDELTSALDLWLLDGDVRLSPATMAARRFLATKLVWWMEREKCEVCGRHELTRFFHYCRNGHLNPEGRWGEIGTEPKDPRMKEEMRPRSIANYFRWLRTFFLFLVEGGELDASPLRKMRPPTHHDDQPVPFSEKQIQTLIRIAGQNRNPKRDIALILILLDTGARESEICGLSMPDLSLSERSIRVRGKGDTHRTLPLSPRTCRAIINYLRNETRESDDPLFTSVGGRNQGDRLHASGLYQIFSRIAEKAQTEMNGVRCSPHTMRHSFACHFLRNGGDPLTLQSLYGHTSLEMTRRYVLLANSDRKAKHGQYSPVARMKLG